MGTHSTAACARSLSVQASRCDSVLSSQWTPDILEELISEISPNYFGTKHIVVLEDGLLDLHHASKFIKLLADRFIFCNILSNEKFQQYAPMANQQFIAVARDTSLALQGSKVVQRSLKWLVLSGGNENLLNNISIAYNCQFLSASLLKDGVGMTELYNVAPEYPRLRNSLGQWNSVRGLEIDSTGFYHRRFNFRGAKLKYLITVLDPCSNNDVATGNPFMCVQLVIWMNILEKLNATGVATKSEGLSPIYLSQKFKEGYVTSVNGLFLVSNFSYYVSYMWPSALTEMFLWQQHAGVSVGWDRYLKPWSTAIWHWVAAWILTSSLVIFIAKRIQRSTQLMVWTPLTAFFAQGTSEDIQSFWERTLLLSILLAPSVLLPSYSGALISFLSVQIPSVPFSTMNEFYNQEEYRLAGVTKYKIGRSMSDGVDSKHVYPHDELPFDEPEGIRRMCLEKMSLMTTTMYVASIQPNCSFYRVAKPITAALQSLTIPLNSPYQNVFSIIMRTMEYSGVLRRVRNEFMLLDQSDRKIAIAMTTQVILPNVALEQVTILLVFLLFVYILSVSILMIELIVYKHSHKAKAHRRLAGVKLFRKRAQLKDGFYF